MELDTILKIAGAVTAISAAVTVIAKISKKVRTWMARLVESERCQLRNLMLRTYYRHLERKELRQYEFENFEKAYEAYKALGGNSFIDKIHEEVREWTVVS